MARGTDFGGIHSHRDLNLIQQVVDVQPAEPKLNLIDIPGADGSKDLSELPAGRLVYGDRSLSWTFALYPGEDWTAKYRQVSNALNGRRCRITLDEDPEYYYDGRVKVKKYERDKLLHQITVEAICAPYMLRQTETRVVVEPATSTTIILHNEKKPANFTVVFSGGGFVQYKGETRTSNGGALRVPGWLLPEGDSELTIGCPQGQAVITYQEGSL